MYLDTMYEVAKHKFADDVRLAERERQIRRAGAASRPTSIDATAFRERVTRLFAEWPSLKIESVR